MVRDDVEWLEPRYSHATPDEVWLRDAGINGWLVVTRDKRIRTRPGERAAILEHHVGCFVITVNRNLTKWEYLKLLVTTLDQMIDVFSTTPRPFVWTLDSRGAAAHELQL